MYRTKTKWARRVKCPAELRADIDSALSEAFRLGREELARDLKKAVGL